MSSPSHSLLAAAVGVTSCTVFFVMNTTLNYITLPSYLLPPLPPRSKSKRGTNDSNKDELEASTDLILRQWEVAYSRGHLIGPGSAIFSTLAYLYAAQTSPGNNFNLKGWYYLAAASAATALPFTVLFILPTNDELYRRAESLRHQVNTQNPDSVEQRKAEADIDQGKGKGKSEVDGVDTLTLIRKCHFLSKIRALTPLPAIVVALYAIARTGESLRS